MIHLFTAFHRISETNMTIAYGIMALLKNLFYFVFKIIVGIVFKNPLLIAVALYNLLIGLVKANCSRGLWKNNDDLKDCKTYIRGGAILFTLVYFILFTQQIKWETHITLNIIFLLLLLSRHLQHTASQFQSLVCLEQRAKPC